MKSWNVLRVLQVFCPTSDQTYGHRCECTALSALNAKCTSHWSVSGHLLVFHRRCWGVCCLVEVVEADITLHNGLIDINLPIYVHPCLSNCPSFPGWVPQQPQRLVVVALEAGRRRLLVGGPPRFGLNSTTHLRQATKSSF